jgi:Tol biopolymer transport system component
MARVVSFYPQRRFAMNRVFSIVVSLLSIALIAACGDAVEQPTPSNSPQITGSPPLTPAPPPDTNVPVKVQERGLYAVRVDDSAVRLLREGFVSAFRSAFDNRIATVEFCESPAHVVVLNPDDTTETEVGTFDGIVSAVYWSPLGDRMLVSVLPADSIGDPMIYLARADESGDIAKVFPAKGVSWSPDGKLIAAAIPSATGTDLVIYDVETGMTKVLEHGASTGAPAWSPDGTWLAFTADTSGTPTVIVVRHTGEKRSIVASGAYFHSWSRDSTYLFAVLATGEQNSPFARLEAHEGAQPTVLARGTGLLSPDEQRLAIYTNRPPQRTNISVFDFETEQNWDVSRSLDPIGELEFSPDGSSILFSAEDRVYDANGMIVSASDRNIYAANPDGSGLREVVESANFKGWSGDGDWVIFGEHPITGCDI